MTSITNSKIKKLWENITDFERHEQVNDSKNPLLAKARQDARMEAYNNLMENELD